MKKLLIILLTFSLTFVSCFTYSSILKSTVKVNHNSNQNRINLVVDAGHGGMDAGTIGVDGTKEKEINLDIALILFDFAMVSGIECFLTRDGDYLVYKENDDKSRSDLYNRMDLINSISNSILISIHQNHFEDESQWGMQVWYSPNDNTSKVLADNILNITKKNIQPKNERLNKQSDNSYYLLFKAKVPSIMVECGFMSNSEENKKLQDNKYQKDLAYCMLLGLGEFITKEL